MFGRLSLFICVLSVLIIVRCVMECVMHRLRLKVLFRLMLDAEARICRKMLIGIIYDWDCGVGLLLIL